MRSHFTTRTERSTFTKLTVEFKPGRGYVRVYVGNHSRHWLNVPLRMFNKLGTAHECAIEVGRHLDQSPPKWYTGLSVFELEAMPYEV